MDIQSSALASAQKRKRSTLFFSSSLPDPIPAARRKVQSSQHKSRPPVPKFSAIPARSSNTFRSSYRPIHFTRKPPLKVANYAMIEASIDADGAVTISDPNTVFNYDHTISIATDYLQGQKLAGQSSNYDHTGYLGSGYSKRGIYVRLIISICFVNILLIYSLLSALL